MTTRLRAVTRHLGITTMAPKSDITLYTANTPNGVKASILLEELGLDYKVHAIDMAKNEQKEPWFLAINPNGRIPALTDAFDDGKPIRIFESGAILQYLVDRYDTEHKLSYPHGSREHWEVTSWLMWQMGGLGPMQGQSNHFKRYAPETIEYGIKRYTNETRRLYSVMEDTLAKSTSGFLVGDRLTIADIASIGWVRKHDWAGVSVDEFPHLQKWIEKLEARPAVKKGVNVPNKELSKEENEKNLEATKKWVQDGMKKDAK